MTELTLENLAYRRLRTAFWRYYECQEIIRFPNYFYQVGAIFCLSKREAWALAKVMRQQGYIELIPFHGIRLRSLQKKPYKEAAHCRHVPVAGGSYGEN